MAKPLGMKMLRRLAQRKATPTEIARVIRDDPAMALIFGANQLNDNQIHSCATRVPANAILFAWYRLSQECQEQCVRRAPAMALKIVPHELTREQFLACKKRAPRAARETLVLFYEAEFNVLQKTDVKH